MSVRFQRIAALVGILLLALPALAADWPQWRGRNRDGKSPETDLLQSWPEGGPTLAWSASGIGAGFSSVAVVGGRIYTLGDLGDAQYALGLDRKDGTILWKTKIGPAWKDEYLGPRSTPTVDGERVYVVSTEGVLFCLDAAKGTPLWQKDLVDTYGASMMKAKGTYDWKFSESPLVDGDRVVVTPGTKDAALVALDKKTGKEIWRAKIPELGEKGEDGAAYSSVVVSEAGGIKHYVQFVGRGLIGIDADDGRFLWGYNPIANGIANIATPLIDGNLVFASSGYGTGSALIELSASDGKMSAKERYFLGPEEMQNHHGGLILHGGDVYTGTGHNKGLPISVDLATGENNWGPVRNDGQSSAAIAYADGRLYFRYQNGLMVLIEATPEAYREHGSFMIPDVKHPSWAHPVIADGKLYLREQDTLYCYDIKRPS
jgi:outer membrane protein assembly factor BamB